MDLVDFDLAKKLKEKGFDESCHQKYDNEGYLSFNHIGYINSEKPCDDFCALAPTISQVLKWLRSNKLLVLPTPSYFDAEGVCVSWDCDIWECDSYKYFPKYMNKETYEKAALAGIEYCLNNLI